MSEYVLSAEYYFIMGCQRQIILAQRSFSFIFVNISCYDHKVMVLGYAISTLYIISISATC